MVDNQIFSSPPASCVKFQFKCPDPKTVFRPSFKLSAHLIVAVGLPHAGLLHVAAAPAAGAVSPLLELHTAKDSAVPGVAAAHAAPTPAAATSAAAPVAPAAGAALLPHPGRGTLGDPRGPTVLHAAAVPAAASAAAPTRNGSGPVGIAPAAPESEHTFRIS